MKRINSNKFHIRLHKLVLLVLLNNNILPPGKDRMRSAHKVLVKIKNKGEALENKDRLKRINSKRKVGFSPLYLVVCHVPRVKSPTKVLLLI